jgi:hypothetical protein
LATAYRDWNAGCTILLFACWLAIVSANCQAQDQQNPQPVAPGSSQQSEAKTTQSPQNQSPQNQTQPIQPPPDQVPQSEPPKEEKKDDNASPAQAAAEKTKQITRQAEETTKKLSETTFNKVRDWENGWLTGPYVSKQRKLVSMTAQQREQIYLQQTLTTPSSYVKRMFVAGVDQLRDSPSGWPEGWGGYGERFASREGQFIIANSLAALGNSALKYEPRYDQCKCSGFRLRTRHAILRNFLTYDQSEQVLHPQWALYGGALAGGLISTAWKPHPRSLLANGGYAVLGQAAYGSLLNFFVEYAGDINRKLGARKKSAAQPQ